MKYATPKQPVTTDPMPLLWSYAFRDGKRTGLILVNLDLQQTRPVNLAFEGAVKDGAAQCWIVSGATPTANNEVDGAEQPQVELQQRRLEQFGPGYRIELPPHSLVALTWDQ